MNGRPKLAAAVVLAGFVVFEFFSDSWLQPFGPYAPYALEVLWVGVSALWLANFFKREPSQSVPSPVSSLGLGLGFLLSGATIRWGCGPLELLVPFDLQSGETIVFLLLVAPVLEESLYRGTWMEGMRAFVQRPWILLLTSAVLFSFSHLRVLGSVPADFRPFIEYQAAYTFLLGAACAAVRLRVGLVAAIGMHFCFNLGFFLASRV
jgi:hypothetical protein